MDSPPFQLSERYSFETPEQIDVAYAIAGMGSRCIAALVDSILIAAALFLILVPGTFGITFVITFLFDLMGRKGLAGSVVPFALAGTGFLSFCVFALYYVLFETLWNGQSPGKRWLGIRVIREGGLPVTFSTAVIRNVVRLIDFMPAYYMTGIVVLFIDRKYRRLGDLAAGTIVVKEQKGVKLETLEFETRVLSAPGFASPDPARPPIRDARHLTPADRRLLREFLQRRTTLPAETADRIGDSLSRTFALKTGYDPGNESADSFLLRLAQRLDEEE